MHQTHLMDPFDWCERCGESAFRIIGMDLICKPPDAATLAKRRLDSLVARVPLMRLADRVIARLEDDGVLP